MIPIRGKEELEIITYPSKTYKLDIYNERIANYLDGKKAVKQAIYKILNTERYDYVCYTPNYGIELFDLIGEPIEFVVIELERRIKEALMQDDRITNVSNFEFYKKGDILYCTFDVDTIYSDIFVDFKIEV